MSNNNSNCIESSSDIKKIKDIKTIKNNPIKFINLNFNLKNEILRYIPLTQIFKNIFKLNKKFLDSLKRRKLISLMVNNMECFNNLIISFDKNLIIKIKEKVSRKINYSEIESNLDDFCTFYLIQNFKVIDLNLKNGNLCIKTFSKFLKYNETILKLYLSHNEIGSNESDLFYLCEGIKYNKSLSKIDISFNLIGKNKNDLFHIRNAISKNKKIISIDMSGNRLADNINNFIQIKSILIENSTLIELNISKNEIGKNLNDVKLLSEGLICNKSLKVILLMDNLISDLYEDDIFYISNALSKNDFIEKIYLNENKIGKRISDMEHIKNALKENTCLKFLNLNKNLIGKNDQDFYFLYEIVKNNNFISNLIISDNILKQDKIKILDKDKKNYFLIIS